MIYITNWNNFFVLGISENAGAPVALCVRAEDPC